MTKAEKQNKVNQLRRYLRNNTTYIEFCRRVGSTRDEEYALDHRAAAEIELKRLMQVRAQA